MRRTVVRFLASVLDPRAWRHLLRLVHYYNYSYVQPVRAAHLGDGAVLAPNVSLRNGERIAIGAGSHIGTRCYLWAGNPGGRITIGAKALFGPEVFVTTANYGVAPGSPVMDQGRTERDVEIGAGVWLGARVIVLPGVSIGDGCVVGAGSVVTKDLPPNSIAVGTPARVVGHRGS